MSQDWRGCSPPSSTILNFSLRRGENLLSGRLCLDDQTLVLRLLRSTNDVKLRNLRLCSLAARLSAAPQTFDQCHADQLKRCPTWQHRQLCCCSQSVISALHRFLFRWKFICQVPSSGSGSIFFFVPATPSPWGPSRRYGNPLSWKNAE